ncbi:hypothetical protein TR51_00075 [Kitasatospora griseola]|uniref:Uncharacterized protein n=1 Tax=Kitasatospora griseola TaxID=2064 RepID=A0A0D0P3F0_KITGR|nr:hypothetical protein TR51_00075 [Kitasatospora griseola]
MRLQAKVLVRPVVQAMTSVPVSASVRLRRESVVVELKPVKPEKENGGRVDTQGVWMLVPER